jgi:hypothetical protein
VNVGLFQLCGRYAQELFVNFGNYCGSEEIAGEAMPLVPAERYAGQA